jgi:Taurine catabolism dioxygenase TauD, TfdA family
VLLRGLPVARWTRLQSAAAFWGLGRHLGDPVPQNAQGHLLGHVKDIGKDPGNPTHRIYQTSYRHLFHTDSCDIVGLMCLRQAKSGGLSRIVSSTTLFNELARRRPDLAEVLAAPFTVDRKGEVPAGKGPHYQMAIAHHHAGQLTVIYARDFIEAAQRFADVPRLSPAQVEAMDLVDELAQDPDLYLDMDFEPGDIQFLHNHQILHARTAYEDHPEPERRRHLLRLWLSTPNGRELPPVFAERYGEFRLGRRRGGIVVPGQSLSTPLDAE